MNKQLLKSRKETCNIVTESLSLKNTEKSKICLLNDSKLSLISGGAYTYSKKQLRKSLASLMAFSTLVCSSAPATHSLGPVARVLKAIGVEALTQEELIEVTNRIIAPDANIPDILNKYTSKQRAQITDYILTSGCDHAIATFRHLQVNGDVEDQALMNGTFFAVDKGRKFVAKVAQMCTIAIPVLGTVFALKYSTDITENIKNFYVEGSNTVKKALYKLLQKGINVNNYQTTLARIEKRLRAELVGQDEAIDRIIEILTGYFESVIEAKSLGKKFEGGLLLYLTGSPATGKSTTMKIIEEEMGLKSYVGRMSDAVEDRGNGAGTVATRLTKPVIKDNGKVKITVDTPLTQQIKTKLPTLYCFDEVDKMRNIDRILQKRSMRNENGKIIGGSVDEMLRNFGDTGQINGQNASGSVLIATSNETPEQLKELEESLYNRYKGCNVHFRNFVAKDYVEIMNRKSKDIFEYYKKKFGVSVSWDKSTTDYYSQKFEKENSGGRGVDTLMNDVRYALKTHQTRNSESFQNSSVSICYNINSDRLFIK